MLADGLNTLRDLFFVRVQVDVEKRFGSDSMLAPVSLAKSQARGKTEIELYQIAESAADVRQHQYATADIEWYVGWLAKLRLGETAAGDAARQRLEDYLSRSPDERRRAFSTVLERTIPDASHAPLIVYRLFPLAIAITTAIAFSDHARALAGRKDQKALLPAIGDCQICHGNLMEIGEKCQQCGNPLWKYDWLMAE
jgi:hypothetical protein